MLKVNAPSHVAGLLDFASGPVCQFLMTADVYATGLPHVEIYGSEASLRCVDPNNFGGTLYLRKADSPDLIPVEATTRTAAVSASQTWRRRSVPGDHTAPVARWAST
jgi:predicted dehydrogenase